MLAITSPPQTILNLTALIHLFPCVTRQVEWAARNAIKPAIATFTQD
jgi:hypothetical protein